MIFRPCRDEEAIKPRSASFLPPEGFLFRRSFCCSLSRVRRWLMERATWTNPAWNHAAGTDKPREIYDPLPLLSHTEASHRSFWIRRTNTFCHLYPAFLPLPSLLNIPILLLNVHLSSSIPLFGISSPLHPQTTWPAAHPDSVYSHPRNAESHLKSNM